MARGLSIGGCSPRRMGVRRVVRIRATRHGGASRAHPRRAKRGAARCDGGGQERGDRPVPRGRERRRRLVLHERADPRRLRADGAAFRLQEVSAQRRARRGRKDLCHRRPARGRRHRAGGHRHRGVAAGRHDVEADRRPRDVAGAERHPVDQPELHDLPRHAARRHRVHLHRFVRRRFDPDQRAGHAERELHAGRRRQQRHLQRRQRRRPGADAGRSGPGVPAPDQPVRRRVRRLLGRRRQRRVEAGHQHSPRHGVLLQRQRRHDGRATTSPRSGTWRSPRRGSCSGAATSAGRSSRTSSISSPTSSASIRTAASRSTFRPGPTSTSPTSRTTTSGTGWSGWTTRSTPPTRGRCAGCARPRRRAISSPA